MKEESKRSVFILIFLFILGASSTACQSLLFREFLVIFYGNEIVLGVILFFWLLAITLGAFSYSYFSRFRFDPERLILNLLFVFSLIPFLLIPFIRVCRGFTGTPVGCYVPFLHTAWVSLVAIFIPAFIIGFTFPLACRILGDRSAVVRVFIVESAGSLAGGLFFSFVLVKHFSTLRIAGLLMALFCVSILLYSITTGGKRSVRTVFTWLILLVLPGCSLYLSSRLDDITIRARWKTLLDSMPLLNSVDSVYQNLALTRQGGQYSVYYNGVYGFSFPDQYSDPILAHMVATQHPMPRDILIIGEVTPGFLEEILLHPVESVTVVYLDPALDKMLDPVLTEDERAVFTDSRVTRVIMDGRKLVKETGRRFDLIFLNLPDPSTAFLNRYYTLDFFREVSGILKEGGVFSLGISSSDNYLINRILDYNRSIFTSLKSVFPHIAISPGTRTYFFAGKKAGVSTEDPGRLITRFKGRNIRGSDFDPLLMETFFDRERIDFKRNSLGISGRFNTDLNPVAYFYNLALWNKYSDSHLTSLFELLEVRGNLIVSACFSGVFISLLILLAYMKRSGHGLSIPCYLFSTVSTGFCAMGLSIILIYCYQNFFGYLFQRIGMLFAMFMLGLSLGGILIRLLGTEMVEKHGRTLFHINQGLVALFCFSLAPLLKWLNTAELSGQTIFFVLIIVAGALTGQILPLASLLMAGDGMEPARSSALADGADHAGGCVGALILGSLIIPLLGIESSCHILGWLCIMSLLLWGVSRIMKK